MADLQKKASARSSKGNYIAYSEALALATREDHTDFKKRELRFHLLFFVFVLPFIILQSYTTQRFGAALQIRDVIGATPFGTFSSYFEKVNTSSGVEVQLPYFFLPVRPNMPSFPRVADKVPSSSLRNVVFEQINSPEQFWTWFQQVILQKIVFPQFCRHGSNFEPVDNFWVYNDPTLAAQLNETYTGQCLATKQEALGTGFTLLQGLRIRQVLVNSQPCRVFGGKTPVALCYQPVFDPSSEDTTPWGDFPVNFTYPPGVRNSNGNLKGFFWTQAADLENSEIRTKGNGVITPSGFALTFPLARSSYYGLVNKLFQYASGLIARTGPNNDQPLKVEIPRTMNRTGAWFFQQGTRGVVVSMNMWNPDTGLFASAECVTSIGEGGYWQNSVNVYVAPAPRLITKLSSTQNVLVFTWAILSVLYFVMYFLRVLRYAKVYRKTWFDIIFDLVNLGLYGYITYWIALTQFTVTDSFGIASFPSDDSYSKSTITDPLWMCYAGPDSGGGGGGQKNSYFPCGGQPPYSNAVAKYTRQYVTVQYLYAIVLILAFYKLVRIYVDLSEKLMSRAYQKARYNLLYFFIIYIITFIGFTFAGHVFYRPWSQMFFDISTSIFKLLLMLLRSELGTENLIMAGVAAPSFTITYFLLFYFIFLWLFSMVLLAEVYSSWKAVKMAQVKERSAVDLRNRENMRLATLYATEPEVETLFGREKDHSVLNTLFGMFKDRQSYQEGKALFKEKFLFTYPRGWLGKERIRIKLVKWNKSQENTAAMFLDREALGYALFGEDKQLVVQKQVEYYFSKLPKYSKLEVDEQMLILGNKTDKSEMGENKAYSLSMGKRLISMVTDISNDHEHWLHTIDKHLATIRVKQKRAEADFENFNDHTLRKVVDYADPHRVPDWS